MTNHTATIPGADAQRRWDEWRAKGAGADRRTATKMRTLILVVATALVVWLIVQLA